MLVVTGAVIGLATLLSGFQFGSQLRCPLFPGEMALLRELDCQREHLSLPGLGEHRTARIAWEPRQVAQVRIRRAQGNRPTCRCKWNPEEKHSLPITRGPRTARKKHAVVSRPDTASWYRGKRRRRGHEQSGRSCRAHNAAAAYDPQG